MTSFKQALNMTRTANGMPAYKSTNNALVDLFYSIGSHRDSDITPLFAAAFNKDAILATKIALWARDARQGAGERKTFYTALRYIEKHRPDILEKIIPLLFEIGRSDDVLQVVDLERFAFPIISKLLLEYDHGLVAK